ncbi:LuxR C-terminal-related transcriptional regulator [Streptomyces massasporeus]|uniref:LuxR C-terminal-related transcriptional regulator n=1 Tax=Streptomyces massasporeus TaxID=67324 RepID=UPI0036F6C54E
MTGDSSTVRTAPRTESGNGCDAARSAAEDRGRAELERGRRQFFDGPVGDARETLLLAASLLAADAPETAEAAHLAAADAAWAAGDVVACLTTLDGTDVAGPADGRAAVTFIALEGGASTAVEGGASATGEDGAASMPRGTVAPPVPGAPPGTGAPLSSDVRRVLDGPLSPGAALGPDASLSPGAPRGTGASLPSDVRRVPDGLLSPGAALGPDASLSPGAALGPIAPPCPGVTNLTLPPDGAAQSEQPAPGPGPGGWVRDLFFQDYRDGMRALLARRPEHAAGPLRRVLDRARRDDRPERLLRAAAAALLLGDVHAARTAGARALAAARAIECAAFEARALEYLAYGELRAGRHAQARSHAEDGVRAALTAGHRNTAASHHAMLALAASIEGDTAAVARYASAALTTARRHGLAQAATLAEWATARADLARSRPLDAADRLGPLVGPGPRRGHFAVWMLAVPCFVEAAVLAGQPEDARGVVADLARWASFGADPHAPAQYARCRALLAADDREADDLYLRALALHDESGGDFERARTELLYGRWLRRRRRLREARGRLGAALVGFDRCGAGAWADQTRGELRANGAASGKEPAAGLAGLTPQQLRIARHVAEGATNREVAQRLAVSTRTVDYHLRNVFAALGVRSRIELARMVDQEQRREQR